MTIARDDRNDRPRARSAPLAPFAIAAIIGVLIDRGEMGFETTTWAWLAGVAALIALATADKRKSISRIVVCIAFCALFAGRHHQIWFDLAPEDIARENFDSPEPVVALGTVLDVVAYRPGGGFSGTGTSRTDLAVEALREGETWRGATGTVAVALAGDRTDLRAGDRVIATGLLGRIAPPLNPGEYDESQALRARGIRLRLVVESLAGVRTIQDDSDRYPALSLDNSKYLFIKYLGRARAWSYERLASRLSRENTPLAAALLLGRREGVDPAVNDAFARTSTTHLLAISGLHLQVLAAAVLTLCRLAGAPRGRSAFLTAAATCAYSLLVGLAPSVVRSAAMTVTGCAAVGRDRPTRPGNVLALAALVTLAINPAHLFDVGCRLSFLAVAAIVWIASPLIARRRRAPSTLDRLEELKKDRKYHMIKWIKNSFYDSITISSVVWCVTLPLTLLSFHVAAPIGVFLNIPLIPLTSVALLAAGSALALSTIWAPLAAPSAWLCGTTIGWTETIARWGGSRSWGCAFDPGPDPIYVWIFYALLAIAIRLAMIDPSGLASRIARRVVVGWTILTAVIMFIPVWPGELETLVLAVGHGQAVLIRDPLGRVMIYDCGRMRDPSVGRRVIAPALWYWKTRRIDSVVLSHADADHYNGLGDLLDRFTIGEVLVPPGFGATRDREAKKLLESIHSKKIPIRTIARGDRLELSRGSRAVVLHPPADWGDLALDNAKSVVLDLSDGRTTERMLLTGDLEEPGLGEFLKQSSGRFRVVLAPHHGGRKSNTPSFFAATRPESIVVSRRPPIEGAFDALSEPERRGVNVIGTWRDGAIDVRWARSGIDIQGYRSLIGRKNFDDRALRNKMTNLLIRISIGLIGIVAGCASIFSALVIEWGAWALVSPTGRGRRGLSEPPRGVSWAPIETIAVDGARLSGELRTLVEGRSRGVVLLLHGFAEDRGVLEPRGDRLMNMGFEVAIVDLRGHGMSGGERVSFGGYESADVSAWLNVLDRRDRAAGEGGGYAVWGRSMGASIALRAAAVDPRIKGLILEASYADLAVATANWLKRMRIPALLAKPILLRAKMLAGVPLDLPRPIDVAPLVSAPILMIHGALDPIAPVAEARRLAAALKGSVRFVEAPAAHHTDVVELGGDRVYQEIRLFLEDALGEPGRNA